jgi:hypothetical protein
MRLIRIAVTMAVLLVSATVQAIMMRHDVDPAAYLLNNFDYQSTVSINGCTATLIAARWILTAAHCVDPGRSPGYQQFDKLTVMAEEVEIDSVHMHPAFNPSKIGIHDIALLELLDGVNGVISTPPYEGSDELGQIMKLAGYGDIGDAERGIYEVCNPCELHGADNRVTEANDHHLRFRFDDPRGGNSLPLEGVGAAGDSGGPAYLDTNAGRFVAGVSSFGSKSYNDFDNYTRVSRELDWLSEVMGDDYPGFYSGPLYSETEHQDRVPSYGRGGGSVNPAILLIVLCLGLYRRTTRKEAAP